MCLFVCGLLYPDMSFLDWLRSDTEGGTTPARAYAHTFFTSMIKLLERASEIAVLAPSRPLDDTGLQTITDDASAEAAACFICANPLARNDMLTLNDKNVVILDAFSSEDTHRFMQYHPVVWHLHCLYHFRQDDTMCCYTAKTAAATYIFISNYQKHFDVHKSQNVKAAAVSEMVTRPLALYQRSMRSVFRDPDAVIIRSPTSGNDLLPSVPLTYAQLLVRPQTHVYTDTHFDDGDIEKMLAFVVGRTHQDILASLPHDTSKTNVFMIEDDPPSGSYTRFANTHYALMMDHKFVIPPLATQEHILFDVIPTGTNNSQHLDYIDAVCQVRYNWVFIQSNKDASIASITPPEPGKDATYHVIDVYRHVVHLQNTTGMAPRVMNRLHVVCNVTWTANGAAHTGIIVFDVQERGRVKGYFHGFRFHQLQYGAMMQYQPDDCDAICDKFGIDQTKYPDHKAVRIAMDTYFDPDALWSLCDMTYKYVIRTPDNQYVIQDSYELQVDPTKTMNTDSLDECPFCPVCFEDVDHRMYYHIKGEHDAFYLPALQTRAATPRHLPAESEDHTQATSTTEMSPAPLLEVGLDETEASSSEGQISSDSGTDHDPETMTPHPVTTSAAEVQRLIQELENCHPKHLLMDVTAEDKEAAYTIAQWKRKYENVKQQFDEVSANIHNRAEKYDQLVSALAVNIVLLQAEFLLHLQELNEKNLREQKALVEKAEADSNKNTEDMQSVLEKHDTQIKSLQETHDAKITEQNEQNAALTRQLQETQELIRTKYRSNTDFDALQQQIDALRAENETLRNTPPPPTDDTALHAVQAQLLAAQAQVATLQAALQQQRDSAARSKKKSQDLASQLLQITLSLRDKVQQNRLGIRELKQAIAHNTTNRISAPDLLQKLIEKDYPAIRRAVAATPVTKRQYSTAATYLHLESMGATWCVYEQNEKKIAKLLPGADRTELDKRRLTVLRQMIYDLTIWFSILNDKHTRYASANVTAFIQAFGLVHNEPADGDQPSTDDERAPSAPVPTLTQLAAT
jgi:hypothetical protein